MSASNKPGFYEHVGWVAKMVLRNPVSGDYIRRGEAFRQEISGYKQ
ncbi:hypothetical protein [Planktothricoides sp. SR001]|nr:hypothetical protein [Planktothricoides sp. SR001]